MEKPVENNQRVFAENENNTHVDSVPESEPHKEPAEHVQNNYVDLVSESHGGIPQQTIFHVAHTESQKKRRRFIPFKFHSKIFKASKKKRPADDHRISTNSSSYASCRTFKKDSGKSNVSSNTYQDIEECIHHAEVARCNSIASDSTVYHEARQMILETDEQGILKVRPTDSSMNRNTQISYQMDFPKKTGRYAKKYMVIFCMILVCAIISAAIASVFSTKFLRENIPSDAEEQSSNGEFQPQTLLNVTNDEVMTHLDDLRSAMEEYSNKTKINIDWLLRILPHKADKEIEMEQSLNRTTMKIELLLQLLPMKEDFEVLRNGTKEETKKYILKKFHQAQCIKDCRQRLDGNYQSCETCNGFNSCSNGILMRRKCAPVHDDNPTFWDDFKRQCIFHSLTCDPLYVFDKNTTRFLHD